MQVTEKTRTPLGPGNGGKVTPASRFFDEANEAFDGADHREAASVGLTVLQSAGDTKTNEFDVDVLYVVLDRQPTGDVVVNLSTSHTTVATVDRAALRFTSSHLNKPQPLALRGIDNQAVNPDRVIQVVVAVAPALSAAEYDMLTLTTFTATITDNEPRAPELPGDYHSDGAVDAADYTVWRVRVGLAGVRPSSPAPIATVTAASMRWTKRCGALAMERSHPKAPLQPLTVTLRSRLTM